MFMRIIVLINSILFILFGLAFLVGAEYISEIITGGIPETASGKIDLRATYGGFGLAIGAVLYLCGMRTEYVQLGIKAVIFLMGFIAAGRILGMVLIDGANVFMFVLLCAEIIMLVIATLTYVMRKDLK